MEGDLFEEAMKRFGVKPMHAGVTYQELLERAPSTPVVMGFDLAVGPDRTVHRCPCGYVTDMIEVLAFHVVRRHGYPVTHPATWTRRRWRKLPV